MKEDSVDGCADGYVECVGYCWYGCRGGRVVVHSDADMGRVRVGDTGCWMTVSVGHILYVNDALMTDELPTIKSKM